MSDVNEMDLRMIITSAKEIERHYGYIEKSMKNIQANNTAEFKRFMPFGQRKLCFHKRDAELHMVYEHVLLLDKLQIAFKDVLMSDKLKLVQQAGLYPPDDDR